MGLNFSFEKNIFEITTLEKMYLQMEGVHLWCSPTVGRNYKEGILHNAIYMRKKVIFLILTLEFQT